MLSAFGAEPDAPRTHPREDITAVLLWKFALFSEWPASDSPDEAPFRIGVLGKDPELLAALTPYAEKKLLDQDVEVVQFQRASEVEKTQLLFVQQGVKLSQKQRAEFVEQGVLLCSDRKGFAKAGGMVELILIPGERPEFEINLSALKAAGVEVRARILSMAREVYLDKDRDANR